MTDNQKSRDIDAFLNQKLIVKVSNQDELERLVTKVKESGAELDDKGAQYLYSSIYPYIFVQNKIKVDRLDEKFGRPHTFINACTDFASAAYNISVRNKNVRPDSIKLKRFSDLDFVKDLKNEKGEKCYTNHKYDAAFQKLERVENPTVLIAKEDVEAIHEDLIKRIGGDPEIIDPDFLEAICTTMENVAAQGNKTLFEQAAYCLTSFCKRNVPVFASLNYSTGIAVTDTFLRRNGCDLTLTNEQMYNLVIDIVNGNSDAKRVSEIIARNVNFCAKEAAYVRDTEAQDKDAIENNEEERA